jgi:hypothetical protein
MFDLFYHTPTILSNRLQSFLAKKIPLKSTMFLRAWVRSFYPRAAGLFGPYCERTQSAKTNLDPPNGRTKNHQLMMALPFYYMVSCKQKDGPGNRKDSDPSPSSAYAVCSALVMAASLEHSSKWFDCRHSWQNPSKCYFLP